MGLALLVVLLGSWVRWSDAGMGCPDWPSCYGKLFGLPNTSAEITSANASFPSRSFNKSDATRELTHRYLAAFLGVVVVLLSILAWRGRKTSDLPVGGVLGLLLLILFQGFLGMLTVTTQLQPLIVSGHLLGGVGILALLWWLILASGDQTANKHFSDHKTLRRFTWLMVALLVMQIASGGLTSSNYAALSCSGFPLCNGDWWPEMDFTEVFTASLSSDVNYEFGILGDAARVAIQVLHRLGAVTFGVVLVLYLVTVYRSRISHMIKKPAAIAGTLLALQIMTGALTVLQHSRFPVSVLHAALADFLLLSLLTVAYRLRQPRAVIEGS